MTEQSGADSPTEVACGGVEAEAAAAAAAADIMQLNVCIQLQLWKKLVVRAQTGMKM